METTATIFSAFCSLALSSFLSALSASIVSSADRSVFVFSRISVACSDARCSRSFACLDSCVQYAICRVSLVCTSSTSAAAYICLLRQLNPVRVFRPSFSSLRVHKYPLHSGTPSDQITRLNSTKTQYYSDLLNIVFVWKLKHCLVSSLKKCSMPSFLNNGVVQLSYTELY